MIGLIQLTQPDGSPFYVNPTTISFFAANGPAFLNTLKMDGAGSNGKGSAMMVAGVPIQFQESPQHIINALTQLRRKLEKNAIKVKKDSEHLPGEEWKSEEGEEDDS